MVRKLLTGRSFIIGLFSFAGTAVLIAASAPPMA